MNLKINFGIILFLFLKPLYSVETINLFSWWDYLPKKELKKFELKNNIKINLVEYRSNDVAISRILSKKNKFDIAIVSGWVMQAITEANRISKQKLPINNYYKNLIFDFLPKKKNCFPYMWGTTIGIAKKNIKVKNSFRIQDIPNYSSNRGGFKVIDDKIEFFSKISSDQSIECPLDTKWSKSCRTKIEIAAKKFNPEDFQSSISESKESLSMVYGWQGELINQAKTNQYNVLIGRKIIIGADYICLLSNDKDSKKHLKKVAKLVKFLSSKGYIDSLVSKFNYFSPYKDSKENISTPYLSELLTRILSKIRTKDYLFLKKIELTNLNFINTLWSEIRYK